MGIGTVLTVVGGACTFGGFVVDQIQRKVDAREAAEEVYREHHPEESNDDKETKKRKER